MLRRPPRSQRTVALLPAPPLFRSEVVAVVVAGLHAQLQWMPRCVTRLAQQFGLQLPGEEFVRVALVDQQRQLLARALHHLDGVVLFPRLPIVAEVGAEQTGRGAVRGRGWQEGLIMVVGESVKKKRTET